MENNKKKNIGTGPEGGYADFDVPKTLPGTIYVERPGNIGNAGKVSKEYPIPTDALLVQVYKSGAEFQIRKHHKTVSGIARAQTALERERGWHISAHGASCRVPKKLAEYMIDKQVHTTLLNRDIARDSLVDKLNMLKAELASMDSSRAANDKELVAHAKSAKKKLAAFAVAWQ